MNDYIQESEMVLMTGGDNGEIISGGFDVGSMLLRRQLAMPNDDVYKRLNENMIPVGLLYEGGKSSKEDILDSITTNQLISEDLYTKLLNDFSYSKNISKKNNHRNHTYRQKNKGKNAKTTRIRS
jgi:hypothetical protein